MLRTFTLLFLISVLFIACKPQTQETKTTSPYDKYTFGVLNEKAAKQTEQLGHLAGVWECELKIRNQDGNWPDTSRKADWIWYYILDGYAIQDDWIVPPLDADTALAGNSFLGTNIRIYNEKENNWEMAWFDNNSQQVQTFKATYEDNSIIMIGKDAQNNLNRITFYNMTDKTFDWKMESSNNEGETWAEVVKIKGRRKI